MSIEHTKTKPSLTYPSLLPYKTKEESLNQKIQSNFTNQIRAFYHHCQKFGKITDLPKEKNYSVFLLNLEKKNVAWLEESKNTKVTVVALEVGMRKQKVFPPHYISTQYWSFFFRDQTVEIYSLEENTIPDDKIPMAYMSGNEVDMIGESQSIKMDSVFWDNWKEKDQNASKHYYEIVYPMFEAGVETAALVLGRPLRIADIASGDADLSLTLAEKDFVEKITCVENNQALAELATKRTECTCLFQTQEARQKITLHQASIIECDFSTMINEPVDVVILSGVAAQQVLSQKESKELLQKCKGFLAGDGHILIASYSKKYFSKSDYEEMGFTVLNSTVNIGEIMNWKLEPFYILQLRKNV